MEGAIAYDDPDGADAEAAPRATVVQHTRGPAVQDLGPIDALPLTVLVPESQRRPIVVYDSQAALRLADVEREAIAVLDAAWDSAGVYLLLWTTADQSDGRLPVYIGEAAQGLRKRVTQHVAGKEGWQRALLVARDTRYGFNSAQVGWLEGRLWSLALAADRVRPTNKTQPRDETLPDYDRAVLETVVVPVARLLRLLGYPLSPRDEDLKAPSKAHYGTTLQDLLAAGLLREGDALVFTYPGHPATATVLGDGSLELNGERYASPSAAAARVRGGATNGWEHWARPDEHGNPIALAVLRAHLGQPPLPRDDHERPEATAGPVEAGA